MIVDAQVHLWTGGLPSARHRQVAQFSAEELLEEMDAAGVDAAIVHPFRADPESNAFAIDAARRYPARLAVLGQFAPDQPESRSLVSGWRNQPGMLGLRFPLIAPGQQTWHQDGTLEWLWPAAERAGLPIALLAGRFLPELGSIARRHPNLKLIVDHCGVLHPRMDAAAFVHLDELLALARLPNVAVKASAAQNYSTEPYPFRNLHDNLHRIFDAYGPERFFWGTDLTRSACSYRKCVTLFTEELPWLKGRDLDLVMGDAVRAWLGWDSVSD